MGKSLCENESAANSIRSEHIGAKEDKSAAVEEDDDWETAIGGELSKDEGTEREVSRWMRLPRLYYASS